MGFSKVRGKVLILELHAKANSLISTLLKLKTIDSIYFHFISHFHFYFLF